jgi:hypothetical protein
MNEALRPVLDVVHREPGLTLVVAVGAYLLLFVLMVWTLARYSRLARRQARLLRGAEGTSLERMLLDHVDASDDVRKRLTTNAESVVANAAQLRMCLQKIGIERYDAFPDVGGAQSFSLALLDADDNGLVLSGLVSRHHMRVYAKPVDRGGSPQSLTDEEKRAISSSRISGEVPSPASR